MSQTAILYPGITNKVSWKEIKGVYPTPSRNLKASGLSTAPFLKIACVA
jgi:hypothetical protein